MTTATPRMTIDDAEAYAVEVLKFQKTNLLAHGVAVYRNSKRPNATEYITYDVDGHVGGVWKAGDKKWAEGGCKQKPARSGTYDKDLNKIAD
ncbi:unnamed protein product [Rotaria socialis]|uniref:Novel toxin 21 domain-containing protein n=1 Tax=Rotaria socialis TaxID=392032 RepID=A0A820WJE1_9BILA|nr:unnamed protein product [Rotaria socialis]CAF3363508.1 unnamed protein product [Rotaria socialis]CAF3382659.1 unnamed protein product [Rotaria socialis]CAF3410616.1 unnamed protein product [Rotaria socialis]CAF3416731.1 unnamed protein product [Rotaria socialis]